MESPWDRLLGGLVLGEADFAQRVLSGRTLNEQEQGAARKLRRPARWDQVQQTSEAVRGEAWDRWAERHGDWGRDGVIYVAVRYGGLRLAEVVQRVKGLKHQAAAQAVKRFGEALAKDRNRQQFVSEMTRHL